MSDAPAAQDWTKSLQLELTRNFPLSDLRVVLALIFFYWASVFIGTQIMRRRPTRVDLGSLPLYHNAINVLVSVYIVVETVRQAFVVGDYGICQPIDPTPKGLGVRPRAACPCVCASVFVPLP